MSAATFEEYTQAERPAGPWLDLAPAPLTRPVHTAIARALFLRVVPHLDLRVELPDGRAIGGGDAEAPLMRVRSEAFFRRLGSDGLIGFGEAFMAGDWDADDPAAVLAPFAARMSTLVPGWMQRLRRFYVHHQPAREQNTKVGAQRNIARHYDLSNELFALFLDESMTYSCGLFQADDTLEEAQYRKVDRLLDATGVGLGTRVLEIGTGWGALAVRAARRGATVTTLTLSREQAALARERARAAGVSGRVDVQLRDYREASGQYDAIVSVEMIEAVGMEYWPTFFTTVERMLAPRGRIGLQAIVLQHDRMLATRDQYTWIHKYVFPGGALPSLRAIDEIVRRDTNLRVDGTFAFGGHYATTLRRWRERFDARAREVDALGFDATFRRMWDFYLGYCEAGFATGYLDVAQIVLSHPGHPQ
ncbi:MAG: cyclopropane-fatty-acyl-phospholipid synthase [Actinomycetota bacterium]|nr:cyclopropane-fatty-acyl-phospholipid synthase [Actinomycetota bacterium]